MTTTETAPAVDTSTITLRNPMAAQFASFIFGNATKTDRVVEANCALGQTLVICGAGPSLRESAAKFCPRGDAVWGCNSAATWLVEHGHKCTHAFTVDQTPHMLEEWASVPDVEYLLASSCSPFLFDLVQSKGRIVHTFHNYCGANGDFCECRKCRHTGSPGLFDHTDPERGVIVRCPECWNEDVALNEARIVSYGVCGACNQMCDSGIETCPHCGAPGVDQQQEFFEDWLYATLYPATIRCGSGLNATTRAIDLALHMGFKKIYVLGADCALRVTKPMPEGAQQGSPEHLQWLREDVEMHADGGSALASEASAITLEGVIDGRKWLTKPDMMITATWLRAMKIGLGSKLSIIGDTLPKAILGKSDEFVARLPSLIGHDGRPWVGKFEERT